MVLRGDEGIGGFVSPVAAHAGRGVDTGYCVNYLPTYLLTLRVQTKSHPRVVTFYLLFANIQVLICFGFMEQCSISWNNWSGSCTRNKVGKLREYISKVSSLHANT